MNWTALSLFIGGASLLVYGVFQIWNPLAWITAGAIVLRIAYVTDERTSS